jgi:hypothetical protein
MRACGGSLKKAGQNVNVGADWCRLNLGHQTVQALENTGFNRSGRLLPVNRFHTVSEPNGQLHQNRTLSSSWQSGIKVRLLISNGL